MVDQASIRAATYGENMLGHGMTRVATCQNVHDPYAADVRPALMQMGGMSGDLDAFMGARRWR